MKVVVLNKTKTLWTIPLILLAAANIASANCDLCLTPYLGVDAQMRHMGFQKDFGGNIFKKNYPQANFFAGLKFNQYVGIELGYESSKKKFRSVKHDNSNLVFGQPLEQPDPPEIPRVDHSTHGYSKIDGWNANLVGFLPILCEDHSLQLIGSIGVAQLKLKTKNSLTNVATQNLFDASGVNVINTQPLITELGTYFKKRKAVLRLSGGIQNMITNHIGIRALITWENTAKLKSKGRDVNTAKILSEIIKPKNSFSYGLGIFASF